jgi:hypothetical protein
MFQIKIRVVGSRGMSMAFTGAAAAGQCLCL